MKHSNGAIAALAILLSAGSVTAYAAQTQESGPSGTTTTYSSENAGTSGSSSPTGSDTIRPDEMRSSKIVGESVYDRNNKKIGTVQDLVIEKDGRVSAAVISVGSVLGIGGKNVALKLGDLKAENDRLIVDRTEDQLKQAANFNLNENTIGSGSSSPSLGGSQNPESSPTNPNASPGHENR